VKRSLSISVLEEIACGRSPVELEVVEIGLGRRQRLHCLIHEARKPAKHFCPRPRPRPPRRFRCSSSVRPRKVRPRFCAQGQILLFKKKFERILSSEIGDSFVERWFLMPIADDCFLVVDYYAKKFVITPFLSSDRVTWVFLSVDNADSSLFLIYLF